MATKKPTKSTTENVNHPKHYNNAEAKCKNCGHPIECIDVVRHLSFNIGNVFKYLWRSKDKNGVEDKEKALWYLQDEIAKDKGISKDDL